MSIKVIGAGLGRTGTLSLKTALQQLGFDKCYHMQDLMANPSQLKYWEQLENGEEPDWDDLFKGYQAAVDFPPCAYYKQMMKKYPDAKVILTLRDADKWYVSAYNTIYQHPEGFGKIFLKFIGLFVPQVRGFQNIITWAAGTIWQKMFNGKFEDREYAKSVFNKWNEEVIRTVPKEKLLVFESKHGWEPLCKFLGVPVPAEPYPRVNDTQEFNSRRKFIMKPKLIE